MVDHMFFDADRDVFCGLVLTAELIEDAFSTLPGVSHAQSGMVFLVWLADADNFADYMVIGHVARHGGLNFEVGGKAAYQYLETLLRTAREPIEVRPRCWRGNAGVVAHLGGFDGMCRRKCGAAHATCADDDSPIWQRGDEFEGQYQGLPLTGLVLHWDGGPSVLVSFDRSTTTTAQAFPWRHRANSSFPVPWQAMTTWRRIEVDND